MFRRALVSLSLAGLLASWACSPAPAPPAAPPAPVKDAPGDIAALNTARQAFMTAYQASDAEAIGKLYTEDATSEPNNQPTLKGRAAIVASLKNMFEQVKVTATLTPVETTTLGNVGLDRGTYAVTVESKAGAPTTSSEGRYLVVYVKGEDGVWRVSRDIDNAAGAPAPTPEPAAPAKQ